MQGGTLYFDAQWNARYGGKWADPVVVEANSKIDSGSYYGNYVSGPISSTTDNVRLTVDAYRLYLQADNAGFTGEMYVTNGDLWPAAEGALGRGTVTVASGGYLSFSAASCSQSGPGPRAIICNSGGQVKCDGEAVVNYSDDPVLYLNGGKLYFHGYPWGRYYDPVKVIANSSMSEGQGDANYLYGPISSDTVNVTLSFTGGSLHLAGDNGGFTGHMHLNGGSIYVRNSKALGNSSTVTVTNGQLSVYTPVDAVDRPDFLTVKSAGTVYPEEVDFDVDMELDGGKCSSWGYVTYGGDIYVTPNGGTFTGSWHHAAAQTASGVISGPGRVNLRPTHVTTRLSNPANTFSGGLDVLHLAFDGSAVLAAELNAGTADKLLVTGAATGLENASLHVTVADPAVTLTAINGLEFTVLQSGNDLTGIAGFDGATFDDHAGFALGGPIRYGYDGGTTTGTATIEVTIKADANCDLEVDVLDLAAIANNFGKPDRTWLQGDFDYDGDVDVLDLAALANNFGKDATGAAGGDGGAPVPEPMTVAILALGAAALIRRRRR